MLIEFSVVSASDILDGGLARHNGTPIIGRMRGSSLLHSGKSHETCPLP
jgi:hypothetical protein